MIQRASALLSSVVARLRSGVSVDAFPRLYAKLTISIVYYQDQVAQRVKNAVIEVGEKRGHILTRRPFQSLWFASQVSICLALWDYDKSVIQVLELAKTLLIPLDTLDALWPCMSRSSGFTRLVTGG